MGRTAERENFYVDLLGDAQRACAYWWYDHSGEALPKWEDITSDDVSRGWYRLVKLEKEERFQCCGDPRAVRDAEAALSHRTGEEGYDACVADAVIQLALLGEVRYG